MGPVRQHFRNFVHEMPRKARRKGYEELSPNQTARELFGHLQAGDKVAITTRFEKEDARPYVDALQRRGLQVRVIAGQTDREDFCCLIKAQKELVGSAASTFVLWAAYIGNTSNVRIYSVDSPDRRAALGDENIFFHYNWTHPDLKSRISFELYKADPI
jgi:hypothetical protein